MIDHVLGRPSVKFRKIQVLAVVSFWSLYLARGDKHGPPLFRKLFHRVSLRLTAWQNLVVTLLGLYIARNFGKLLNLECPEPLANLYSRSYFRATWITTALDAGFWTAMKIRRKWLRDLASMVFSVYYLIAAEQADEKVRKVRGLLTVDHIRVSWNKPTSPYLNLITKILRPTFTRYPPRAIRIPRPAESSYKGPVNAWLYFDGPLTALKNHSKIILDVPGGGFVAMTPRAYDDSLLAWAGKTGLPVLSLDYKKAPEYPYPYALNECYDVYQTLATSRGRCIGFSGEGSPRIIVTGDSAGGNLATGLVLMILQSSSNETLRWSNVDTLPAPEGLILIYPSLDMNIGNWMTDEQMSLIKDRNVRATNRNVLRRKSEDYNSLAPSTPHHSDDDEESKPIELSGGANRKLTTTPDPRMSHDTSVPAPKPQTLRTRLAMSSMISYFNDRILTPEMMRAMIILYVGPHNRPDFSTDFLLSPLLAPEALLARFPKTYFLTGERDPLVDDTVIFAGRLRQAKKTAWLERKELGILGPGENHRTFPEDQHVHVNLISGVSHGFLQFVSVFPEAWKYINRSADWAEEIFDRADSADVPPTPMTPAVTPGGSLLVSDSHLARTESSGDEDRPLEMTVLREGTNGNRRPRGSIRRSALKKGKGREQRLGRNASSVSLASEDDLLGRRMQGFTGGLMGEGSTDGL
ncbi:MAG: hypothetical protein M1814_006611 [Vezdaea aestivalis]|nr:MAG: hypothetical protein M1814_006611 [Vezdaea aestivalis]